MVYGGGEVVFRGRSPAKVGGGAVRKHVMSKKSSLLFWMPELVHTECAVSGHRQGFLQLVPV